MTKEEIVNELKKDEYGLYIHAANYQECRNDIDKYCISCDTNGHTYLECKKVSFIDSIKKIFKLS